MAFEVQPFVPDERRPRDWAADVRDGKALFSAVPAHLAGMVRALLSRHVTELAAWVASGQTREERRFMLDSLPAGLRGMVQDEVMAVFAKRKK